MRGRNVQSYGAAFMSRLCLRWPSSALSRTQTHQATTGMRDQCCGITDTTRRYITAALPSGRRCPPPTGCACAAVAAAQSLGDDQPNLRPAGRRGSAASPPGA
eukprot:71500-Prymnesium_polylepis.2